MSGIAICLRSRGAPSNRLMGMCRWMESHFYDWIDYWIAFSISLLEWDRYFRDFGGKNIPVIRDFKPEDFYYIIDKCANLFQDDLDKRLSKVDA